MSQARSRTSFWYSKIQDYLYCPTKYYRKHVLGEAEPPTLDLRYGSGIHLGAEVAIEGGDPVEVFEVFWADVRRQNLEAAR